MKITLKTLITIEGPSAPTSFPTEMTFAISRGAGDNPRFIAGEIQTTVMAAHDEILSFLQRNARLNVDAPPTR